MTTVVTEEKIEQRSDAPAAMSPEDQAILEHVKLAAHSAEEKKAHDILVLRLTAITEFTDYFIICSGASTRQTQAIADEITDQLARRANARCTPKAIAAPNGFC